MKKSVKPKSVKKREMH